MGIYALLSAFSPEICLRVHNEIHDIQKPSYFKW